MDVMSKGKVFHDTKIGKEWDKLRDQYRQDRFQIYEGWLNDPERFSRKDWEELLEHYKFNGHRHIDLIIKNINWHKDKIFQLWEEV